MLPLVFASGSFSFGQNVLSQEMTIFNSDNSPLSNNSIHALLVDHSNALWIATDLGLNRLANEQWEVFNTSNSGLTDNYIRALAVDANDVLWIGTVSGGLFKFDGTTWTNYNTTNSGLPTDFVRSLAVDLNGDLWVGTIEGLLKFDGTNWTIWTIANAGIFSQNISSIAVGLNNEKYCGTINGGAIYVSPTEVIQNHTIISSGIPDNSTVVIQMDAIGRPWFATPAAGLFTDTGALNWLSFNVNNSPLPTNSLTTFHIDQDQNFLIGTDQYGLIIRNANDTYRTYSVDNSDLPETHMISITRDSSRTFWIGMYSKGLVKMTEQYADIDEKTLGEILVYPNPAISNETIYFSRSIDAAQISLTSNQGKVIYQTESKDKIQSCTLPNLTTGSYFLKIVSSDTVIMKTLVVR